MTDTTTGRRHWQARLSEAQTAVDHACWERRNVVADARKAELSWEDIGRALNMSKQAAWEQFREIDWKASRAAHEESGAAEETDR
jgi:hypothetical protein